MSKQEKERIIYWEREAETNSSARFEVIAHFDARGKHRVYGRSDNFGKLTLNMDVWRAKDGRLLVRFWSHKDEIDWCSYEIINLSVANRTHGQAAAEFGEHWIPECIREEYQNWVLSGNSRRISRGIFLVAEALIPSCQEGKLLPLLLDKRRQGGVII